MWGHLWVKKPPPQEYQEMLLMERFGWTWDELQETPGDVIADILTMWDVESRVHKAEGNRRAEDLRSGDLPT